MSWRAMEAVQDYSRYQGPEHYTAFRVLLALASFADENGVVGAPGDFRSCPGHRAIAERAHLHRNTIANILPQLLKGGELEVVEEGGTKRGSWTVYRICLPVNGADPSRFEADSDVPNEEVMAQGSREGEDKTIHELAEVMAQGLAQMQELMAQMREVMAQGFGTFGTTVQRGVVPDPIIDPIDPDRDPGDPRARAGDYRVLHEDSPPFSAPAPAVGEGDPVGLDGNDGPGKRATVRRDLVRPVLDGVGRRRAGAIAEVCGLDMRVRSHRKRCEEAALQLSGYPEEYILARYGPPDGEVGDWNWFLHDWRGRRGEQPEPRLVVETIGKGYVGPGDGVPGMGGQDAGAPAVMSNNEATARKYAELRRKMLVPRNEEMED